MKVAVNLANPIYRKIESTRGKSPNAVSVIPEILISEYPIRGMSTLMKNIKDLLDGNPRECENFALTYLLP